MSVYSKNNQKPVSYYEVLQLSDETSDQEVRKAYYRMAKLFHPDKHPHERRLAELRFRLINEAYNNLKTKSSRLQYNKKYKQALKNYKTLASQAGNDNVNPNKENKTFIDVLSELLGFSKNGSSKHV